MLSEAVSPTEDQILYLRLAFTATFFAGLFQASLGLLRYQIVPILDCLCGLITKENFIIYHIYLILTVDVHKTPTFIRLGKVIDMRHTPFMRNLISKIVNIW